MANNVMMSDGVVVANREVKINQVTYPFPDQVAGNNVTIIDRAVYVDGYELNRANGKWSRTLRALWHLFF